MNDNRSDKITEDNVTEKNTFTSEQSSVTPNKLDDTLITIFKAIVSFITDLNSEYGSRHKSIALYNRLLEKTGIVNIDPIQKHIESFRKFFNSNKQALEEKNSKYLIEPKISYSDKVYIDVQYLLKDKTNAPIIWKHLLTIWYLIDPSKQAKKLLQESMNSQNSNKELDFLSNIFDKVGKTVEKQQINTENPMAAITGLMSSGVFSDIFGGIQSSMSSGDLDLGKMMSGLTGMIQKMNPNQNSSSGAPDLNNLMQSMSTNMFVNQQSTINGHHSVHKTTRTTTIITEEKDDPIVEIIDDSDNSRSLDKPE